MNNKTSRLVYSSEKRKDIRLQLGSAHYSYRFVEERFLTLLKRMGLAPRLIESPESLKHILAFEGQDLAAPDKLVHLIFRSSDNIRLVYGARNICHFAWEFDVLNNDGLPHEPITQNQLHMLTLV